LIPDNLPELWLVRRIRIQEDSKMKLRVGLAFLSALAMGSATSALAQSYSSWTTRGVGRSVSSQVSFGGVSIRRTSYEYETRRFAGPGSRPWRTEKVDLAPNDCGPRSFQVVNAGVAEPICVGAPPRR
jgi:hypothetical protein